jgi:Flp pilus assembly protein TadG
MIFALMLPVTLGVVGVATDYSSWSSQHQKLQKGADAAALAAASELSISSANETRISAIVESVVRSNVPVENGDSPVEVTATILPNRNGVKVVLTQKKKAIMSALVTPALTDMEVGATATMSGNRKVCVVALDTQSKDAVKLDMSARITASDCAIFSNSKDPSGVRVQGNAIMTSNFMCSSGGFSGTSSNYSGPRQTDCPAQPDPLAKRPPPQVGACLPEFTNVKIDKNRQLSPGTYCGGIMVTGSAKVTFAAGTYIIKDGPLKFTDNSDIYGRNVSFYFTGDNAEFEFTANSVVNLGAPRDGGMAGILFFGDRNAPDVRKWKITSNNARTLLGTLYLPRGTFMVDAVTPVADQSAYTAIVASRVLLYNQPNLTLNTNYFGTDVPVPEGLGPSSNIRLVQ